MVRQKKVGKMGVFQTSCVLEKKSDDWKGGHPPLTPTKPKPEVSEMLSGRSDFLRRRVKALQTPSSLPPPQHSARAHSIRLDSIPPNAVSPEDVFSKKVLYPPMSRFIFSEAVLYRAGRKYSQETRGWKRSPATTAKNSSGNAVLRAHG